jgi:CheY-like chemotaxis protein
MKGRRILIVDDSPADRTALRMAFERTGLAVTLGFAASASEALAQLHKRGAPRPQMMLVDIHMPGASGLELLANLKGDKTTREIPVFMLSGSQNPRDIGAAYRGQACGFIPKPDDFDGLRRLAELLGRLCVETLEFPESEATDG